MKALGIYSKRKKYNVFLKEPQQLGVNCVQEMKVTTEIIQLRYRINGHDSNGVLEPNS